MNCIKDFFSPKSARGARRAARAEFFGKFADFLARANLSNLLANFVANFLANLPNFLANLSNPLIQ